MSELAPIKLPENRPPVYYSGGANISRFRGVGDDESGPEDWVGSLCALPDAIRPADAPRDCGIARTATGESLGDLVAVDPVGWFGEDLAVRFGGDPGLLVKLLDSGERLPVHCHPTRAFAGRHLGSMFGKTEGWVIMHAEPGARVWVGMRSEVDRTDLRGWIDRQNVPAMLAAMNEVPVRGGDVVYVPAGLPHSIGPGVFITELQEPTSFSVLAEHDAFGVADDAATLGLGWDLAVSCFDLAGYGDRLDVVMPPARAAGPGLESLFAPAADDFFRCLRASADGAALELADIGYAILIVTDGAGQLRWDGGALPIMHGDTLVVPAEAGSLRLSGAVRVLVCRPAA